MVKLWRPYPTTNFIYYYAYLSIRRLLGGGGSLRRDLGYLILFSIMLLMAIFVIFLSWGGVEESEVGCLSV